MWPVVMCDGHIQTNRMVSNVSPEPRVEDQYSGDHKGLHSMCTSTKYASRHKSRAVEKLTTR